MRVIVVAIVGLVATVAQAAPVSRNAHSSGRSHETPAENVRKSQWYDHILSTNPSFLTYRTHRECNPIVNDRDLRNDCIRSFDQYEPFRPRVRARQSCCSII